MGGRGKKEDWKSMEGVKKGGKKVFSRGGNQREWEATKTLKKERKEERERKERKEE